ncbi:hypothetical protein B0H11DRAFT_2387366 [Mycena galericulata]|nr:hypothetical protein B0H11DRAFT_2387366 [Mycena galericulata]
MSGLRAGMAVDVGLILTRNFSEFPSPISLTEDGTRSSAHHCTQQHPPKFGYPGLNQKFRQGVFLPYPIDLPPRTAVYDNETSQGKHWNRGKNIQMLQATRVGQAATHVWTAARVRSTAVGGLVERQSRERKASRLNRGRYSVTRSMFSGIILSKSGGSLHLRSSLTAAKLRRQSWEETKGVSVVAREFNAMIVSSMFQSIRVAPRWLPDELIIEIIQNISKADQANLCRVSKLFRSLTLPVLNRDVALYVGDGPILDAFCSALLANPARADTIRSFTLWDDGPSIVISRQTFQAIQLMTRLEHLGAIPQMTPEEVPDGDFGEVPGATLVSEFLIRHSNKQPLWTTVVIPEL